MHIDGFRFDLASVLSRDEHGRPLENPPVLWDIETDPALAGAKLIAEAWDAGGLYQVGSFIGDNWKEWNGRFRDDVRGFLKGDPGTISRFASRLLGSPDIYGKEEQEPEQSINFITCHDGFTLNDLVSYDHKHNDENGEDNRDGSNDNLSWNCGAEGPTDDSEIEKLRNRQVKNFHTITLFSTGAPMLLMGDEVRRTQKGNNNAYCHDNEISWFDWDLLNKHGDIHRFVKQLIRVRLRRDVSVEDLGLTLNQILRQSRIEWHGTKLNEPDWGKDSRSIALTVWSIKGRFVIHLMVNAFWEPITFQLPPVPEQFGQKWRRWIDTYHESPHDICILQDAPLIEDSTYLVQARSIVAIMAGSPKI
jgi:glycogen operon protein